MRISSKAVGGTMFFLPAVYYILNRYPGPAFIDSGELALSSYTLGVPHPTGYPLYLIITAPAAHLFNRPITGVTLCSSILTALAAMVFFHLITLINKHCFRNYDKNHVISGLATLVLFLAPVVAAQGVTNEVYGLALLVNLAAVYAAIRVITDKDPQNKMRCLVLASYLSGLSLCNHMSSVQLIPALLFVMLFVVRRYISLRLISTFALAFVIPLTLYIVLPIRAASDPSPVANWGDVTTWENFTRHVSGWQFQVWMFTGKISEIWFNIKVLAKILHNQFPPVTIPFMVFGIIILFRRARYLLIYLLLIITVNIGLGINYSIPDIDSYYLLAIALLLLLAATSMYSLGGLLKKKYMAKALIAGILIWQIFAVHGENYRSDYTLPEDYALNIFRSADFGAVIMSELWDHHSQAFYLQQAEGLRPDLKLIDKELLRRSWYYKTIRRVYPEIYRKISDLAGPFLDEIRIFEQEGDFDAARLEFYYQAIINRLLTKCGPAYIDYRLNYTPEGDHYLRPQGILYRVDTIATNTPIPQPKLIWRGRPLGDYDDWRARHHVGILRQMGVYQYDTK